jgi:pimeloyl-ACP methyl ester carboxylesterase
VLLHGTSSSLHTWDGWALALAPTHRVIRYDMPGFGLTGPAADGDYSVEGYVRVLVALLDSLGVRRCVLAGNSLGGHVAWAAAALHPDRVARLVLVDAAGYPFRSTSVPIGFRLARAPVVGGLLTELLPRRVVESSVRDVYGDPSRVTPALVDRYFDMTTRAGNRRAVIERFRQTRPGALSERVPTLRVPTLILWGGRDRLIPPASGDRFHREIAGSRLVVFPDLGHVPHEEDPARTVAEVATFLARPSPPRLGLH